MAGSRGFLLVLLLATVTCIVLIQVSLDGWIRHGSLNFYQLAAANKKEITSDKNLFSTTAAQSTNTSEPSSISARVKNSVSVRRLASPWKFDNVSIWNKNETVRPLQRVEAKVRVRNLAVEAPTDLWSQKLLFEHKAKVQKMVKYKDAIRKRMKADPMKGVKSMPITDPSSVNRILLITYFRSGSSFLGELLQQNWKTFYQFEPLHYMTYGNRISDANKTEEAFDLFSSIYNCNFSGLDNYFSWVKKPKNQFLFTRSLFLWSTCRTNPRICFNSEFVSAVCKRAPVQAIKTTRIHMWQLQKFLEENPDLNIKVVYLTRDPRGIISSRWSLPDWCNGTNCSDPNVICSEIREDIQIFEELRSKEPSKFIRVRYEDLALQPETEAHKLFQFLNLTYSQSVRRFLKSHTTARKSDTLDPYSTRRNSASMAYSWKQRFNFEQVKTVQKSCSDVINKLNYSLINNSNELYSFKDKTSNSSLISEMQHRKVKQYFSPRIFVQHTFRDMPPNQFNAIPSVSKLYDTYATNGHHRIILHGAISNSKHSEQGTLGNENYIKKSNNFNHTEIHDNTR